MKTHIDEYYYSHVEKRADEDLCALIRNPDALMDLIEGLKGKDRLRVGQMIGFLISHRPTIRSTSGRDYIGVERGEPERSSWAGQIRYTIYSELVQMIEADINNPDRAEIFNAYRSIESRGVTGFAE